MPQERRLVRLTALETTEDQLPTEFLLFAAGVNDSDKGAVLFDEIAQQSVMAAFAKHGVDFMIDLEHLSLCSWSPSFRGDAMGWGTLELRGAELWCAGIKWTDEGARRLRERSQRYTSPAFYVDELARVTKVVNVALTALPATYNNAALIAANQIAQRSNMKADTVKKLLDAIEAGDLDTLKAIAKDLVAEAASGETPTDTEAADDSEDTALSGAADETPVEEQKALSAALVELRNLTGKTSLGEVVAEIKRWSETRGAAQKRQDELDLDSRRDLVGQLVKLGNEIPATAWEGDAKDRKPVARLMAEPLAELRNRVAKLSAAKPPPTNHKPPKGKAGTTELSAREQEYCKRHNLTPEQFAEHKQSVVVRR